MRTRVSELELTINSNSGIEIDYLKKMNWNLELELRNLEFEVSYKKINPKINIPFLQFTNILEP